MIWINYNNSLTWNKVILGIPLLTIIPEGEQASDQIYPDIFMVSTSFYQFLWFSLGMVCYWPPESPSPWGFSAAQWIQVPVPSSIRIHRISRAIPRSWNPTQQRGRARHRQPGFEAGGDLQKKTAGLEGLEDLCGLDIYIYIYIYVICM